MTGSRVRIAWNVRSMGFDGSALRGLSKNRPHARPARLITKWRRNMDWDSSFGEMEMHYGEAVLWIQALEWFIREQGLEIPTWPEMEHMGWKSVPIPEIQVWKDS